MMYKMIKIIGIILLPFIFGVIGFSQTTNRILELSFSDKQVLKALLQKQEKNFDARENMIVTRVNGYQYHTDATSGDYHQIRSSFQYALALLNTGDESLRNRAFEVISIIPTKLYQQLQHAILLAANSIVKRDVSLGYTNIALMDTYVTYMAGYLLSDANIIKYATNKLNEFYKYTLAKNGFTEYNSPNYTITAMEELNRMQLYFVNQEDKKKVDSLYHLCWQILARHYHIPSGQWTGPHSRSYNSLVTKSFYNFLAESSGGKIGAEDSSQYNYTTFRRYKHVMPKDVEHYFVTPDYPRTEVDVFEPDTPKIIGTSYLASKYALSSINHASLWNQRRPLIAYWGTKEHPQYLQVRFLHDNYDFSSASLTSAQDENKVLAAINFVDGMGDKHITIDKIKDGLFTASDLRLRFEFGNTKIGESIVLPTSKNTPFLVQTDQATFQINLIAAEFNNVIGYWEKGTDGKNSWIDFVFYAGTSKQFSFHEIETLITVFTLSVHENYAKIKYPNPSIKYNSKTEIQVEWGKLKINANTNILPVSKHAGWF